MDDSEPEERKITITVTKQSFRYSSNMEQSETVLWLQNVLTCVTLKSLGVDVDRLPRLEVN